MDDIDTSGWWLPDGISPTDCVRIVRGDPGRIERLVVEVPAETGRTLSDLLIGGVPLVYGGQIAECITVKLVGGACDIGSVKNKTAQCIGRACVIPSDARMLQAVSASKPIPPGLVQAFAPPHAPHVTALTDRTPRASRAHGTSNQQSGAV